MRAGHSELGETNDKAGNSYLRAHVEELGDDAADKVPMGKSSTQFGIGYAFDPSLTNFRKIGQEDQKCD